MLLAVFATEQCLKPGWKKTSYGQSEMRLFNCSFKTRLSRYLSPTTELTESTINDLMSLLEARKQHLSDKSLVKAVKELKNIQFALRICVGLKADPNKLISPYRSSLTARPE